MFIPTIDVQARGCRPSLINARYTRRNIYVLFVLLHSWLAASCGILTEAPGGDAAYQSNYPADFAEFLHENNAHSDYNELVYFLASHGVQRIVPVWQLLQQGSDWKSHSLPKYALPPRENWSDMVNTLVFLKYDLIPYIGPVRVLSGFRTPNYNQLAGGAGKSRHLKFSALDLRPVAQIERSQLHGILQNRWNNFGREYDLGLGLYASTRFHIDTGGFRQW